MSRKLIICLTILLSACGQKSSSIESVIVEDHSLSSSDSLQNFSITKTTLEDFIKAKKNYNNKFIQDTLNVKKIMV